MLKLRILARLLQEAVHLVGLRAVHVLGPAPLKMPHALIFMDDAVRISLVLGDARQRVERRENWVARNVLIVKVRRRLRA